MIATRELRLVSTAAIAASALAFAAPSAHAQDPKFEFGKAEEVEKVEWKAAAQAGLTQTTGNSKTTTLTGGGTLSRKAGDNKLSAEANVAYARSSVYVGDDANADGFLEESEIDREATTTAKAWLVKARYDRFLAERDSLYLTGIASGDKPAGKEFVGGGQAGYSRTLFKDDDHDVVAETGYDFSYEDLVVGDPVSIHSLRVFVGYVGKVSEDTGISGSVEALFNVNSLDTATGEVSAFEDTRITGKAELTTKLWGDLSLGVSFQAKFDNAPPARPPLSTPYLAGFVPTADELDTITKVSLLYSFL